MRIKVGIAILYINRKLFSRAIVGHHKIYILLKGHFTINKKDQAYERPYNSRWSAQFYMQQSRSLGILYLLSENILIKHCGIFRTAESRIMLLRIL